MEEICTAFLGRIGALVPSEAEKTVFRPSQEFPVEASVVIPVFNRARTIKDAVLSALAQKTDFSYNVIVVDNWSDDGTSAIVEGLASSPENRGRLVHIFPEKRGHGIGGCWNTALENAASIAGMFLTTECVITEKKEENPAPAMPAGGMGGMM